VRMECLLPLLSSFIYQSREILDGLRKVGFRLNTGLLGTGLFLLTWSRAGGYYIGTCIAPSGIDCFSKYFDFMFIHLDTGGSKLIGEGKIKLKNDSPLEGLTETGLKFEDGSELQADVVIFATG